MPMPNPHCFVKRWLWPPLRVSHICGCRVTAPQVLQGLRQDPEPLSQGRAMIAKPSRGVSPQHTAQLSSHCHYALALEKQGWSKEGEGHGLPEQGPRWLCNACATAQGTTALPGPMTTTAHGQRPVERYRSSGHGTPARAVPALATLACLAPPCWHCSHKRSEPCTETNARWVSFRQYSQRDVSKERKVRSKPQGKACS